MENAKLMSETHSDAFTLRVTVYDVSRIRNYLLKLHETRVHVVLLMSEYKQNECHFFHEVNIHISSQEPILAIQGTDELSSVRI